MTYDNISIKRVLAETVSAIEANNLNGAEELLDALDFGKLLQPPSTAEDTVAIEQPGPSGFNPQMLHLVGGHINMCVAALSADDEDSALTAAKAALASWGVA